MPYLFCYTIIVISVGLCSDNHFTASSISHPRFYTQKFKYKSIAIVIINHNIHTTEYQRLIVTAEQIPHTRTLNHKTIIVATITHIIMLFIFSFKTVPPLTSVCSSVENHIEQYNNCLPDHHLPLYALFPYAL